MKIKIPVVTEQELLRLDGIWHPIRRLLENAGADGKIIHDLNRLIEKLAEEDPLVGMEWTAELPLPGPPVLSLGYVASEARWSVDLVGPGEDRFQLIEDRHLEEVLAGVTSLFGSEISNRLIRISKTAP